MHSNRSLTLTAALAVAGLAGTLPAAAQTSTASELVVRAAGEQTELALGSKAAFHRTSASVQDARRIELPDGALAVTWSEVDELGESTPWYAISTNGASMATVQATSYEIAMQVARFDPQVSQPDFSSYGLYWDGEIHLVQFETQVLGSYRAALEGLGARVYNHLVNHTLIVHMTSEVRAAVEALPFVRWVGPFDPALRVEPELHEALANGSLDQERWYNLTVFERGLEQKELVSARIAALGGDTRAIFEQGVRFEAQLSPEAVVAVLGMPEVASIDRWGPAGHDLDVVREFSGANYLENQTGFSGQGVRAEVMDSGLFTGHPDLQHNGGALLHGPNGSFTSHGTSVTGVVFGDGTNNPAARGLLPNGKIVFARYDDVLNGTVSRYTHTAELTDPSGPYRTVFQTNSWGSPQTSSYTSISQEMDDILFINDIVILQSQSNTGSTNSRPQAWAKNILGIGGICHENTLSKSDDNWCGASTGPATDGRKKPDLAHFYDDTQTTSSSGGYTNFSGTSNATPCTAGHVGLFYQMWHNNFWNNGATGATVFDSKSSARLARAALVNSAQQWTFSGANHNLQRDHQGWGAADMKKLHDTGNSTFLVDETDVLNNLATNSYNLAAPGGGELKVTLCYRDPMAVNFGGVHRINNIDLRVTAPNGDVYWGNVGLHNSMWSTTGGGPNNVDVIENVFVQVAEAGTWTIDVIGADINTDIVAGTAGNNADYALWVSGISTVPCIAPVPYCTAKQTSGGSTPVIGWTGSPSSVTQDLVLTLTGGTASSTAVLFSGSTMASTPFQGGTLCVGGTITREATTATNGAGAVNAPYTITGPDIGSTKHFQWWMRDLGDPFGIGLSAGLAVAFCNS